MLQKAPKTYWSTCEQVPSVAATAYIADTATVTGHVEISEGVMVCPCLLYTSPSPRDS